MMPWPISKTPSIGCPPSASWLPVRVAALASFLSFCSAWTTMRRRNCTPAPERLKGADYMTVVLDHHIIPVRDKDESAGFLSRILGLSYHGHGSFASVHVGETILDF